MHKKGEECWQGGVYELSGLAMMFGLDLVALTKRQEAMLEAAELKMLRFLTVSVVVIQS